MNDIITAGVLLSAGAGLLYYLKGIPKIIWIKVKQKIFYSTSVYDTDLLFHVIEDWLFRNHNSKYRDTEAGYTILDTAVDDPKKKKVYYRQGTNFFSVRYKGRRIFFQKTRDKLEQAMDKKNLFSSKFSISGYKSRKIIEELLSMITEEYNKTLEDDSISFYIYNWGNWSAQAKKQVKTLDKIVLRSDIKSFLVEDLDKFSKRKSWYSNLGVPYKRTYGFYGPPGTGKSTLAFAIAAETKRDIYVMNLNSFSTDDYMIHAFDSLRSNSLLLIEDIDSCFFKRENKEGCKVSFSSFLNCLDGAFVKENVITVITTNHIDKLDPALVRDGRMDVKIEIGNPTEKEISEYLSLFYEKNIEIKGDFNLGMATIQEICFRNQDSEKAIEEIHKCEKDKREKKEKVGGAKIRYSETPQFVHGDME